MELDDPTTAQLEALLARRPCGLLTDVDGTISEVAPTPEAATVDPRCRAALQRLAQHLELVAVVSGRAAGDIAAMVGLEQLVYVGNHGMERWEHGTAALIPEAQLFAGRVGLLLQEAQQELDLPGLLFEDKGLTGAVHYRLAPDPGAAQELVRTALEPIAERLELRLTPGRMVWEIRPPINWGKGAAVERLVEELGLRSAIFLGDDTTDVNAFRSLAALRAAGQIEALIVGVVGPETPAEVIEASDVQVLGVAGIARLLETLADMAAAGPAGRAAAGGR